ncbi:protein IQ-DOMAIN 14-like [Phoenix dactylifera]|uniref:Protein IQ-DOMAIN 14-like n=1 Tax=Phoenix dactylifera TaxID=42345 RepID=A0A8B7C2Z7_PHODC|nr:protein IQ-DOMAIN 14-like [Phoenix dactylifera]XP_008790580.1 protein IQ-DOMAIN 14-like [Phoenix dactylifera]XP_017698463.1 protein IQ-DOMAIN 14-like [Phoenix dactylifera]
MGKKGNWFTALIRAFTSSSKDKDKPIDVSEKKNIKEKKRWGFGRSKHREVNSFFPLSREPSSIEKILCDAEREQRHKIQQAPQEKVQPLKKTTPAPAHLHAPAPKPSITPNYVQMSAIKIQAAYRRHLAKRSYRALKGLMRLQGVMRGHSVKRQTMNAMKCMQMLGRVQSQIRARRLQMMESRRQMSDKEIASSFGKWSVTHQSEVEAHEKWDESVLTKEEIDARMRRKVKAVIKRERALAYAYSHQLMKVTPKSAHAVLTDIRNGGFPWWWNWLEHQLSPAARPSPVANPIPRTPITPSAASQPRTPSRGTPRPASASHRRDHRGAAGRLRDDESLTGFPAPAVPSYMAPTASARAKVRTLAEDYDGKRRFSFGLGQSVGSLQWSKGGSPFAAAKDAGSQRMGAGKHKTTLSVDSTVSLPAGVGRTPFK